MELAVAVLAAKVEGGAVVWFFFCTQVKKGFKANDD